MRYDVDSIDFYGDTPNPVDPLDPSLKVPAAGSTGTVTASIDASTVTEPIAAAAAHVRPVVAAYPADTACSFAFANTDANTTCSFDHTYTAASTDTPSASFPHLTKVFEGIRSMEFDTQEDKVGNVTIKPSTRRQMKKDIVAAFVADCGEAFDADLCNVVVNDDGIMMIVEQEIEGFITIQVDFKVKNLDYEPLY